MILISIGVTLLSGGLDSTTVSAYARSQVDELTALTFSYGQSNSKELQSAQEISHLLGVRHEMVDISSFGKIAWYSSLTNPDRIPLPMNRSTDEMAAEIPKSYVPLRNTFFVTVAGAYLESRALYELEENSVPPEEVQATLFMAPNAVDFSGYPDCRPEYFEKMQEVLKFGSKLWSQYSVPMLIKTPIINLSKAEIVQWAMELQAPLEHTWTCYRSDPIPCGACDSCLLRAKGFVSAGYADPLLLRLTENSV